MHNHNEKITLDPFVAMIPERMTSFPRGPFDKLPAFEISKGEVLDTYKSLANEIKKLLPNGLRVLVIDGYQGVNWEKFKDKLINALNEHKINPNWMDISNCYASSE